jgi:hypothetical protein
MGIATVRCWPFALVAAILAPCAGGQEKKAGAMHELLANPAIVVIRLNAAQQAGIRDRLADKDAPIHLGLAGTLVINNGKSPKAIRVFVNKPDATEATPIDDPHYVFSSAFGTRKVEAYSFSDVRNIAPVLRQLHARKELHLNQPLTLTLVVTPEFKDAAAFRIDESTIEFPPAKSAP